MLLLGTSLFSFFTVYLIYCIVDKRVLEQPNFLIGYRTPSSMKSKEVWMFAQQAFNQNFKLVHLILIIIGVIWGICEWIFPYLFQFFLIELFIYILGIIIVILLTEIDVQRYNKQKG